MRGGSTPMVMPNPTATPEERREEREATQQGYRIESEQRMQEAAANAEREDARNNANNQWQATQAQQAAERTRQWQLEDTNRLNAAQQADRDRMAASEETARVRAEQAEATRVANETAAVNERRGRGEAARNNFMSNANAFGSDQISGLGLSGGNDYGLSSSFQSEVNRLAGTGSVDNPDSFSALDYSGAFQRAQDAAQGRQRRQATNQFDAEYGSGFADERWQNTADDEILNSILGEQRGEAEAGVNRALARGTLLDTGRDYAMRQLDRQNNMGMSRAQSIGGGVLSGYRTALESAADRNRGRLSNLSLGQSADVDRMGNSINSLYEQQQGSLEGDVLNAIGDQDFFNLDALLKRASSRSGIVAPTVANPNGLPVNPDDQRTVANAGVI